MSPSRISVIHTRSSEYRDKITQLWTECLPDTPEDRFEWLAEGNPEGPAEWFLAINEKDGDVVGTGTLVPRELFYNGEKFKGGIVGDLMVSSAVRKQGIAQRIQKKISDNMEELGMEFLYVVPNGSSNKLLMKAGINNVYQLKSYLLPVNFEYYFKKVGLDLPVKPFFNLLQVISGILFVSASGNEQCTISTVSNFDEEIDDLWKVVKEVPNTLIGTRSSAYLNWKYCRAPASEFQILACKSSSGVLVGYIIFSVVNLKLHIFELVYTKNKDCIAMVSELRKFAVSIRVVGIYLCTTKSNPALKSLWWRGFIPVDGSMQVLAKGGVFKDNPSWSFFRSDRNL